MKIVAKFGGSNLKDARGIRNITSVIKTYGQPMVVVVSAFYGITNTLSDALKAAGDNEAEIHRLHSFLDDLNHRIMDEHITSADIRISTEEELSRRMEHLRRYLLGINYISEIPPSVHDAVLSYGERMSSLILTGIFQSAGIATREALPEDIGLRSDGEFGQATVDVAASRQQVSEALSGEQVFVVPGFYAIGPDGRTRLLGRGGSDYSAAAIASCVGASSLDIWKDVDGYLSADPRLVENPRPLEQLSYREAAELSYFGARILHPRTVEPLRPAGIPIRIFNIEKPQKSLTPLSRISAAHQPLTGQDGTPITHRVKSVTHSDDFAVLRLNGSGVGSRAGVLGRTTNALASAGINIKSVVTTQTSINLFLSANDIDAAFALVEGIGLTSVKNLETLVDYSMVALVGEGLEECEEIAEILITALVKAGIHAKMLSIGASSSATYCIVRRESVKQAVRAVHEAFFPGESS